MAKTKQSKKECFGTKEWSENSGICNNCEFKDACGKVKKLNKSIV